MPGNKSKRRRRKNNNEKSKANGKLEAEVHEDANGEPHLEEDEGDEPETPIDSEHPATVTNEVQQNGFPGTERTSTPETTSDQVPSTTQEEPHSEDATEPQLSNGTSGIRSRKTTLTNERLPNHSIPSDAGDTEARLEALAQERAALREQVTQLRQSLEEIQGKHQEELRTANDQLEEVQGEKEHIETQYQSLRGKVGQIQSNLKERLRADAVCLGGVIEVFLLMYTRKSSLKHAARLRT